MIAIAAFAAASDGPRNSRSGSSGQGERASSVMNAASSETEPASGRSAVAEV
jgi:hypothetical protein